MVYYTKNVIGMRGGKEPIPELPLPIKMIVGIPVAALLTDYTARIVLWIVLRAIRFGK